MEYKDLEGKSDIEVSEMLRQMKREKGDIEPKVGITGFTCGVFDLLHAGHILALKESREQCDELIVGLQKNARMGKNQPIETFQERLIRLEGCKYVSRIIPYDTEEDLYKLLKSLVIDKRFLGADHKGHPFTGDDLDMKVVFNSRDHDYSSTNLRKRMMERIKDGD